MLAFACLAPYARKETVPGYLTPTAGTAKIRKLLARIARLLSKAFELAQSSTASRSRMRLVIRSSPLTIA